MSSSPLDKLRNKVLSVQHQQPKRSAPVWKGPEQDGVTFSLLSRFLVCRERFRLLVVEGLRPADTFNHRIHYGNMWHLCEEYLAQGQAWEGALLTYARDLAKQYPMQQEQVSHWYEVCKAQFPIYVAYWAKHPDVVDRAPLLQEETFSVPYKLPSGRTVRLRGKWDSVDLIGSGDSAAIYLQENKTKGDIKEAQLQRQLRFDLQTMLYLVALEHWQPEEIAGEIGRWKDCYPGGLAGVRYNVIRRPLSGGRHSIVQHKATKTNPHGESRSAYYSRLASLIREDAGYFFMRWRVDLSPQDIERFRHECLDPVLEQLCSWWDVMRDPSRSAKSPLWVHWRHPYGVYNVLDEGGSSELDGYLDTRSESGLEHVDNLFPELS